MIKPETTTAHHRTISGVIDRLDLKRLVAQAVLQAAGEKTSLIDKRDVKVDVKFIDETEGSPSYRVGVRAVVTITEDMSHRAECKEG